MALAIGIRVALLTGMTGSAIMKYLILRKILKSLTFTTI